MSRIAKGRENDIIDAGMLHLMALVEKGRTPDGWTPVSKTVWPAVMRLSDRLLEKRPGTIKGNGGHVRLTSDGRVVLEFGNAIRKGVGK